MIYLNINIYLIFLLIFLTQLKQTPPGGTSKTGNKLFPTHRNTNERFNMIHIV